MGNGTTRVATVYTCAGCSEYYHVSKVVFNFANANADDRLGANEGYSYGMSVDYSDLTKKSTKPQSASTFSLSTTFTFTQDKWISAPIAHLYITTSGHVDKALGYVSGFDDKLSAINNMLDYYDKATTSGTYTYTGNLSTDTLKGYVYFAFLNENQLTAYRINSIYATATFDFGEPVLN